MSLIGIMQGRLVPPQDGRFQCFPRSGWQQEFSHAAQAGLDSIEWIYDLHGADVNPIATDEGIERIRQLAQAHAIAVTSLCADYFMDRPFARAGSADFDELAAKLLWLIGRCQAAGITRIVMPFVDQSRIEPADQESRILNMLRGVLPEAEGAGVELHLETSYGPDEFARLLSLLPHPFLKANYDSGNSSSLGYDPRAEIAAYGERIGSVHIKDRLSGGGTVPLGKGDANIPAVLSGLAAIGYAGDYILQVARDVPGKEVAWAAQNLQTVRNLIAQSVPSLAGGGH